MIAMASMRVTGAAIAVTAAVWSGSGLAQSSIGLAPKAPPPAAATSAMTPAQAALDGARVAWEAMGLADRIEIQSGLVWSGDYTGSLDGTFGRMTFEALTAFQARHKFTADGIVTAAARKVLAEVASKKQTAVGWQPVTDAATGVKLGIPTKLVGAARKIDGGTQWASKDGRVDIRAFSAPKQDLAQLYERMKVEAPGRRVTYSVLRADWFVIADTGAGRDSYTRFVRVGDGVRGFVIIHDPAIGPEFGRVVIAAAGTFEPVAGAAPVAATIPTPGVAVATPTAPVQTPPTAAAPSLGTAATGLIVAPGKVLTAALGECRAPTVAGKAATLAKADAGGGLALLEVSGLAAAAPWRLADGGVANGADVTLAVSAPGLSATAGTLNERGVRAALQRGGLGAAIFDGSGRLLGLVTTAPDEKRLVMGMVPQTTYRYAGAADLASAIEAAGGAVEKAPAGAPTSSGAVMAANGARVVAITCGK